MIKSEATISNLPSSDRGPKRMWYGSAAASEFHDMDWLKQHLKADEEVEIKSLTNDQTILLLAGPKFQRSLYLVVVVKIGVRKPFHGLVSGNVS